MLRRFRRRAVKPVARTAVFTFFLAIAVIVLPAPASADDCTVPPGELVPVENPQPGEAAYRVVCPGNTGDGDDTGDPTPMCDPSYTDPFVAATRWCEGENACWANIPSAVYPTPDTWPEEPPTPDSIYIYKRCYDLNGAIVYDDWGWFTPNDEPPIEVLAMEAFGQLRTPAFSLEFNPPTRSYVRLETWWWADGAGAGDITGSAAFNVVAIGEPDYIEVDPGDGSDSFECPWTTTASDACTYTYPRASVNGTATAPDGAPAYPAEARLVYSIRFEQNGTLLDLPGLPDTLESPWVSTPVPVAEIQATVIG